MRAGRKAPAPAEAGRGVPGPDPAAAPAAGTGPPAADAIRPALSARLNALARLIQIGSARGAAGFSPEVLAAAEDLLARAGERLRLSSDHTVVALAGGTGSGKSSLFNCLAGADFSTVGVTRPVTRDTHACVWGVRGSAPLLDWLSVPRRFRYARASALGGGEESLTGLVLLDLPDHDSVLTRASGQVDQLVGVADLVVWVLDPQKYADAAVHRRFLVPLAGHSEVLAVVLNQSDLLSPGQTDDCVDDLRRLLDSEGLHEVQILVTSAATGDGLDELRKVLAEAVSARRSAVARISSDVDTIVARFASYAGDLSEAEDRGPGQHAGPGPAPGPGAAGDGRGADPGHSLPAASTEHLISAFSHAAGGEAVADALASARELRALDFVGWPMGWLAVRITGRDPVRKVRLSQLWAELRGVSAGPSGAQQAEVDNALTQLAEEVGPALPGPWSQSVRSVARSRAEEIPGALGSAIAGSLPADNAVAGWWRLVGAWQGLLLGAVIVGLAWMAAIVTFGAFHAATGVPRVFRAVSLLPWIAAMIVALLLLGWLTASACMNLVRAAAENEKGHFTAEIRGKLQTIGQELVIQPVEQELSELARFRAELRAAAGQAP